MESKKKTKVVDKKAALLRATLELVNNEGFHDAPMSKIAQTAHVSAGTIYLYFKNKQDLINKLYLTVKQDFGDKIFEGFDPTLPVKDAFEKTWHKIADYKIRYKEEALFLAQCDNTPMIDDSVLQIGLHHLQPLLALWERGRREGVIKDVSPYLLYAFTVYPLTFLLHVNRSGKFRLDNEQLETAFNIVWDSIKK